MSAVMLNTAQRYHSFLDIKSDKVIQRNRKPFIESPCNIGVWCHRTFGPNNFCRVRRTFNIHQIYYGCGISVSQSQPMTLWAIYQKLSFDTLNDTYTTVGDPQRTHKFWANFIWSTLHSCSNDDILKKIVDVSINHFLLIPFRLHARFLTKKTAHSK